MHASVARIGRCFLALTALAVTIALLHVWDVVRLSPSTVARLLVTYALLAGLFLVHALVAQSQGEPPRSGDGDRLID
jgi:hypothetical protein